MEQAAAPETGRKLEQDARDHDGKSVPSKESTVYVRDDAYGKCTNRGTDLVLIWKLDPDKVVRDPTNTSNCHENGELHAIPRRLVAQTQG